MLSILTPIKQRSFSEELSDTAWADLHCQQQHLLQQQQQQAPVQQRVTQYHHSGQVANYALPQTHTKHITEMKPMIRATNSLIGYSG